MNIYTVKKMKSKKKDKSPKTHENKTGKTRQRFSNDPLKREEVETLLNSIDNIQDHAFFVLGFYSGMRISEIISIEDISLNEGEGRIHIWDEKKNLYRDVYVPVIVFSVLKRYINSMKNRKDPRLFPFSKKTAERKIESWTTKILAKTKSWHSVRHTYISLSRELELPMEIVISNTLCFLLRKNNSYPSMEMNMKGRNMSGGYSPASTKVTTASTKNRIACLSWISRFLFCRFNEKTNPIPSSISKSGGAGNCLSKYTMTATRNISPPKKYGSIFFIANFIFPPLFFLP